MGEIEIGQAKAKLQEGADLKGVLAALAGNLPYEAAKEPTVPAKVKLTDKAKSLLGTLPHVFGRVQPEEVRRLTPTEVQELHAEYEVLNGLVDELVARREAVKRIVRNHMDMVAVSKGLPKNTDVDKNGNLVVARKGEPERVVIPGTDLEFSREFRSGRVDINVSRLEELHAEDEISREDYLALTVERRVFDEEKAMRSIQKRPSLLGVVAKITDRGRPSTSLYVRKAKNN